MNENRRLASNIIGLFEDLLGQHGLDIPNKEREDYGGDPRGLAHIFGSDYYSLEDSITTILDERG